MTEEVKLDILTLEEKVPNQEEKIKHFRKDEPWSDKHEALAKEWLNDSKTASEGHNKAGKASKKNHIIWGLPSVLIPLVFGGVCALLNNDPSLPYVSFTGFTLSGVFGGIDKFFDYSGKHTAHMNFSAKYADIVSDIKYQLSMSREFREDPDSWLTRLEAKYDGTGSAAPDL